jgi:AraC family transcriptional regulator of adaptative response/methylated-DNA-[protein]-cysteine methyltransferase
MRLLRSDIRRTRCIAYTLVECSLGAVLLAATERGVCQIRFVTDAEDAHHALRREFPFASLEHDAARLEPWSQTLVGYLEGRATRLGLPLDGCLGRVQSRIFDALGCRLTATPPASESAGLGSGG